MYTKQAPTNKRKPNEVLADPILRRQIAIRAVFTARRIYLAGRGAPESLAEPHVDSN